MPGQQRVPMVPAKLAREDSRNILGLIGVFVAVLILLALDLCIQTITRPFRDVRTKSARRRSIL